MNLNNPKEPYSSCIKQKKNVIHIPIYTYRENSQIHTFKERDKLTNYLDWLTAPPLFLCFLH